MHLRNNIPHDFLHGKSKCKDNNKIVSSSMLPENMRLKAGWTVKYEIEETETTYKDHW